jgi:hypothetical protein
MKRAPVKVDNKRLRQHALKTNRAQWIQSALGKTLSDLKNVSKQNTDAEHAKIGKGGAKDLGNRVTALENTIADLTAMVVELVERNE